MLKWAKVEVVTSTNLQTLQIKIDLIVEQLSAHH